MLDNNAQIDNDQKTVQLSGSLAFIHEVAKYFMDFLETDFHKRKYPKRSIKLRSDNNLLVGLNLNKYQSFEDHIWKTIEHGFSKDVQNTIPKGAYRTTIPKNLLELIDLYIKKI